MPVVYTKTADEVFNPLDGLGAPRGANMAEARTWGTEVETAIETTSLAADDRATIADDTIYALAIPGAATAIVSMIATVVSATFPAVTAAVGTGATAYCEKMAVSDSADVAGNVIFTTAASPPTDHTVYTDAKLTLVACSDGNLYIVNRLGGNRTYGFHIQLNAETV